MRVLEAGVGSGALSMALLRAGADVVGYELREDFAAQAAPTWRPPGGGCPYRVEIRDVYAGIDQRGLDRVLLDLPEPWRVLWPTPRQALRPGGILCAYLPSHQPDRHPAGGHGALPFGMAVTLEVLHRTWHVEPRSVRPDHRMVGHTGFFTTARLLIPADTTAR